MQAAHDARISLRTHLGGDSNVYEVCLYLAKNKYYIYQTLAHNININIFYIDRLLLEDGETQCQP